MNTILLILLFAITPDRRVVETSSLSCRLDGSEVPFIDGMHTSILPPTALQLWDAIRAGMFHYHHHHDHSRHQSRYSFFAVSTRSVPATSPTPYKRPHSPPATPGFYQSYLTGRFQTGLACIQLSIVQTHAHVSALKHVVHQCVSI